MSRRSRRRAPVRCTPSARLAVSGCPCRPRRGGEACPHGHSLSCGGRHRDDDACLGEAIHPECFDYARAAPWNHNAGRLFRRTRLRRWAYQLGYGGHCFTKSRRFSTTFKPLREARALFAAGSSKIAGESAAKSDHNLIRPAHGATEDATIRSQETRSSRLRRTRGPGSDGPSLDRSNRDGDEGGGVAKVRVELEAQGQRDGSRLREAERYVGRVELAAIMGVSVTTVDRLVRAGMPSETWGLRERRLRASRAVVRARGRAEH